MLAGEMGMGSCSHPAEASDAVGKLRLKPLAELDYTSSLK